mmetsp:Transcript_21404/g.34870  ORF Transcript_21404/g.34870 Transcript_21404/m.34870 type:complete len:102 (+) Transcript_21404:4012-4317(+)
MYTGTLHQAAYPRSLGIISRTSTTPNFYFVGCRNKPGTEHNRRHAVLARLQSPLSLLQKDPVLETSNAAQLNFHAPQLNLHAAMYTKQLANDQSARSIPCV